MQWYLSTWLTVCLVVVVLAHRERRRIELFQRGYWEFLLRRWKLATFAVAARPSVPTMACSTAVFVEPVRRLPEINSSEGSGIVGQRRTIAV